MPDENKILWQRIDEQNVRLRTVETDTALLCNESKSNKENIREVDRRLTEHAVKAETTTEQLMLNVHSMKEDFSGFKGEIQGSINSLKVIIPVAITAIGATVSGVIWVYNAIGDKIS